MNHPLRRVSLQAWLVAAFVAVGAIASVALLVVLLPRLESSVRQDRIDRNVAQVRAAVSVADANRAIAEGNVSADAFAQDIYARLTPAEVRITGQTTGVVTGAYPPGADVYLKSENLPPLQAPSITEPLQSVSKLASDDELLIVTIPVPDTSVSSGTRVFVAIRLPSLGGDIATLRTRILLAVTAILALASLMGLVLSRVLSRKIARLARTASTLAGGDLSARSPETSPRELAILSEGLNRMAGRIEDLVEDATHERDRTNDLIASLEEGVIGVGPDGGILVANPSAIGYLGASVTAEGATIDSLPSAIAEVVEELRGGVTHDPVIQEVVLASGIVLMLSAAPLPRSGGVVATLRDVTYERRLERARRDLIANVSHELKTPLTALKGFLELLEDERMGPPQRREFLDLMSQEAGRLERLVVEQLELARLDSGALPLETQGVDLLELAEGVVESRYLLFAREGVHLVCAIGNDASFAAEVDPARVEQILLILLDNALRHTPSGGRVELRVSRTDDVIALAVGDTGEGIPEDAQAFVFDRFYRADPSREGRGAGLGLAIARGLAEAHGGAIELVSQVGTGTTFTVRLPAARVIDQVAVAAE